MQTTIRVAQIKVTPDKGDIEANHATLLRLLFEVGPHSPDVVVTPECFLDGYVSTEEHVTKENIARYAIDPHSSKYVADIARWSSTQEAWCVLGCTRAVPDGARNAAIILDRAGYVAGTYDKVHCQTHDMKYIAGDALPVFESDFGPFGVMICADRRWPETVRTLALKGARVIFNPTYGMHDERNLCMMRTRSFESEVYIVFTHPAQSLVTGPKGEVITNCEDGGVPFTITDIDLLQVDRVRGGASAHLRDRRPEVYSRPDQQERSGVR